MQNQNTFQTPIISSVNQFCERHPVFKVGGMRHLIFNEQTNGLAESGAIVRIGRKITINEEKFFAYIENQNNGVA
jgi:hypothetical protein